MKVSLKQKRYSVAQSHVCMCISDELGIINVSQSSCCFYFFKTVKVFHWLLIKIGLGDLG